MSGIWPRDLRILIAHLLTTIIKRIGPGGAKAVVAGSYPDSTNAGIGLLLY